ncbi:hypothetical protein [Enterobacter bugandensis]|uniref:hypothetical protein n=1 Tax=Enterobacter bugandensis TaxID=881260 RepID=UPI002D776C96|nr:hypothetical protein [Enterobacter bugandensis]WRT51803.1 hypothetical protein VK758_01530 [Enterobacter bugandensis]
MKKNECVFCKKQPPEIHLTREHVLPDWMGEKLKADKTHGFVSKVSGKKIDKREVNGTSILDVTVKRVCNICNNGWMSKELEEPLAKYIELMAKSQHTTLDVKIQSTLALWAFKTALIRSLINGNEATISEYFDIVYHRKIPKNTHIWLIDCSANRTLYRTRHIWFKDKNNNCIAFSSTLVILGFTLQVLSYLEEKPVQFNLNFLNNQTPNASRKIWPLQQSAQLKWPLPESINIDPVFLPEYILGPSPLMNLSTHL